MSSNRLQQLLHSSLLEFWLPLPLLGVLFWFSGNLMAEQILSRSYDSANNLQADTQLDAKLSMTVVFIQAEIDKTKGVTLVAIKTTDSRLKKLEFEFANTNISKVETAIAQELGMSIENVRKLVRYQIKG